MSKRDELIKELTKLVNTREGRSFTTEDVSLYIGSDLSIETLNQWIEDTQNDFEAVTASDIDSIIEDLK